MRNVPVAQLDRVSDSDSDGCRFDPCRVRQNIIEALKDRLFYFVRKNMHPFVKRYMLNNVLFSIRIIVFQKFGFKFREGSI